MRYVTQSSEATPCGPPDARGWLDEHGDALHAFALSRGLERSDAEDVVQDTLLTGIERWATFRRDATVRTWLTGILRYKILELGRTRRGEPVEKTVPDETGRLFGPRGKWRRGEPAAWHEPDDADERDELRDALRRCLDRLPRRAADAFLLVEHHGLSVSALARVLGTSANNVHALLFRARSGLRHCLDVRWFSSRAATRRRGP